MTEEALELTKRLVSVPSTLGDTAGIEETVIDWLSLVKGADAELIPVGNIGNDVIARVSHGRTLPTLVINGHLDTVDVCKGWTRDPFRPAVEGDRLYGLGSADMKAGVAVGMLAFKRLAELGCVNVTFAGTVDEEGDSAGAFVLLERGIRGDLCLIPEPSGGKLMMGCRGRVVFEATVSGASAHGSRPSEGINAILEASRFVTSLESIPLAEHPKLGAGSVCVLEMSGGTRTLSVPDTCWLKIDRHYVTGESRDGMLRDMRAAAEGLNSRACFDIAYWRKRPTPFLEPYVTDNRGLVKAFTESVGGTFSYGKSVGDYNAFAKVMPTVVYGPQGTNWHSPNEHVGMESVRACLAGYYRFAEALRDNKPFIRPPH